MEYISASLKVTPSVSSNNIQTQACKLQNTHKQCNVLEKPEAGIFHQRHTSIYFTIAIRKVNLLVLSL